MIIQSAPKGQPHFVIEQVDHARMSGRLAEAFGNAEFAPLDPREPLVFMVAHHDEGWAELDARARRDPNTGLPYHLTQTPLADLLPTNTGSPDFNERHHPLSGLISSMHTWGLYHGRYGLSDFIFIDRVPTEMRPQVDAMLDGELQRQERLKARLRGDPATAQFADEAHIFTFYKLLQFFDTLSLYFHTAHAEARKEAQFKNVPRAVGDDVTVTIKPTGDGRYALSPFPFAGDALTVWVEGRYLTPQPEEVDLAQLLRSKPKVKQEYVLVKSG
jgi:hypothetical protein